MQILNVHVSQVVLTALPKPFRYLLLQVLYCDQYIETEVWAIGIITWTLVWFNGHRGVSCNKWLEENIIHESLCFVTIIQQSETNNMHYTDWRRRWDVCSEGWFSVCACESTVDFFHSSYCAEPRLLCHSYNILHYIISKCLKTV